MFNQGDILESYTDEFATHLVLKRFDSVEEVNKFTFTCRLQFNNLENFKKQATLPIYLIKDLMGGGIFMISHASREYFQQMNILE